MSLLVQVGGSAACAAGGPLTAAGASLWGGRATDTWAATGAAPGETGEGRLAAGRRFDARGGPEAGQSRNWQTGLRTGLVRWGWVRSRPLGRWCWRSRLRGGRRRNWRLSEVVVDQVEGHSRVVWVGAVHGTPHREGWEGLLRGGVLLAGQQVTGRQDGAVGAGAQPPWDEEVKPGQILYQLDAGIRNLEISAVVPTAAAGNAVVARSSGDNKTILSPQATSSLFRLVTAAASVTSWTTTISPGTWNRPSFCLAIAESWPSWLAQQKLELSK